MIYKLQQLKAVFPEVNSKWKTLIALMVQRPGDSMGVIKLPGLI